MPTPTPPAGGVRAANREQRRAAICDAAAEQFARYGFAAAGVDAIGAAAGISGPAVYRYFSSKQDLLAAVIERGMASVAQLQADALATAASPRAALEELVRRWVTHTIRNRHVTPLWLREADHLEPSVRSDLARRQRMLTEEWVHLVAQLRPDLSDSEARTAVHAISGLMGAALAYDSGLDEARLRSLVGSLVLGALTIEPTAASRMALQN